MPKKRILILCTGNSARSQMAEGLLRHDAGDRFEVESAGVRPSEVRPEAVAVMREIGIDISRQRSKHVDEFGGQTFDYVLTVCDNAQESCPIFPAGAVTIHHNFDDPAALQLSFGAFGTSFGRICAPSTPRTTSNSGPPQATARRCFPLRRKRGW